MHNSTLIVLVILTIGQMLMMAFGAFILWMMGDLGGDAPQQMRREDSSRQSGKNLVHVPQEVVKLVEESPDELISPSEEASIAPKAAEDQVEDETQHPGSATGKAA